jgi:hypothetical protein
MSDSKSITKTRNWAFVIYPESSPANWREMLEETHMQILISPLHDKDVSADGEIKKEHYHIVIMSDGPITQKRANEIIEPFNGTKSAEYIKSLKGYARYLAHLDNPEKAQYDPTEIIAIGGADLTEILKLSRSDRYQYIGEMIDFCKENHILEFADLLTYSRYERPDDWFHICVDSAYFLNRYLTSQRFIVEAEKRRELVV